LKIGVNVTPTASISLRPSTVVTNFDDPPSAHFQRLSVSIGDSFTFIGHAADKHPLEKYRQPLR
jgi:hypothetical protein